MGWSGYDHTKKMYVIFVPLAWVICFATRGVHAEACEPITADVCRDVGYNVTRMPNLLGQNLQADAIMTLQTYQPLIQIGCSDQLEFFLCSVFLPMCIDGLTDPIGPCQTLCDTVQQDCGPILNEFGFDWPEVLTCSTFPVPNNHVNLCMEGP